MNDNSKVVLADVNDILPNRFQPRIQFDETEILELSDSIKEHGIIQPIVVRPVGDKWEIVAGERRYKAAVLAGLDQVPIISKNLSDKESAEIALIENIQRKNLTPIEEALSYKKILDMGYVTQEALANKVGKSQPSIANKIRLLNLSDEVQEALLENRISERHARSLLRLKTSKDQNYMLNKIITERLTVRKTDEEIQKYIMNEEKGEINMNNNKTPNFDIFGQPVAAQPTQSNFQSFQQPQQAPQPDFSAPLQSSAPTEMAKEQASGFAFDLNNNANQQPTEQPSFNIFEQSPQPQPASQPSFNTFEQPTQPQQQVEAPILEETKTPNFDIFGQPQVTPNSPITPNLNTQSPQPDFSAPLQSSAPTEMAKEQASGFAFDLNNNANQQPTEQPSFNIFEQSPKPQPVPQPSFNVFEQPTQPQQQVEAPITSPIVESSQPQMTVEGNNTFGFGPVQPVVENVEPPTNTPVIEQSTSMPSATTPIEPIIVTDYNKQYDPIMPQDTIAPQPVVDFKEVIKAIRECSEKIENYGFKIDVEEYDLENLYQAVFKIEKK